MATLNVGTGEVLYDTRKRHTAKDVLAFFKFIDLHVPKGLEVHVVLDNLSAHKAPGAPGCLAGDFPANQIDLHWHSFDYHTFVVEGSVLIRSSRREVGGEVLQRLLRAVFARRR